MKDGATKRCEVLAIEILQSKGISPHRGDMQQLQKGHLFGVARFKTYPGEVAVVTPAVASVVGKQKRVVYTMPAPESRAIPVIIHQGFENRPGLDAGCVVGVEPDEEKPCGTRIRPLIRLSREEFAKNGARVNSVQTARSISTGGIGTTTSV